MKADTKNKVKKADTREDFEGITLLSFDIGKMYEYDLKPLNEFIDEESFFEYLEKIDNDKDFFTYYRGDNLKGISDSPDFLRDHGLGKIFVVGHKGMGFFKDNFVSQVKYEESDSILLEDLIQKIERKFPKFDRTKLPDDDKYSVVKAIIHNSGIDHFEEKKESYYISVAVGNDNFEVANDFALENSKKSFILMGVKEHSDQIIDSEYLAGFMVQNYEIIEEEKELLIKNVLWPFSIIGIFIIFDNKKEFVVNPWLVVAIKNNRFNKKFYFDVNQEMFDKFYKDMGYKSFIVTYDY
ncbi:hypothetical protein [Vagococcus fluvialis]|uniref:hypothetical protein n=1 Tax=Vagococcus fluvialis TaxID=2738 RepID=UPI001D0BC380|nr:hypothetical protein [Vagococcus fluvialis]UDM80397.1 hypothetical protein K5K97_03465 [Vagococcus fluvialis]